MNADKIDEMILALLDMADHDLGKSYRMETAEEPELVEEDMDQLRAIVISFIGKP